MHFVNTSILAEVASKLAHGYADGLETGHATGSVEKLMGQFVALL
jgi:hypothetical protein